MWGKKKKKVSICIIDSRSKNLNVTLERPNGEIIISGTSGKVNLKGPKKKTYYAAEVIGRWVGLRAQKLRINGIFVKIKGELSKNVKAAITGLQKSNLKVWELELLNYQPHNKPRLRKERRK